MRSTRIAHTLLSVLALVSAAACSKEPAAAPAGSEAAAPAPAAEAAPAPAPAAAAPAPAPAAAAAPTPAADPAAAQYTIAPVSVTLAPGAAGEAKVVIKPAAGLHFNEEYPAKFEVAAAPFAKATKDKLTFKEGDLKVVAGNGELTVPLQGVAAGEGALAVTGSFSVCSDETCHMLKDQKFSIAVAVK